LLHLGTGKYFGLDKKCEAMLEALAVGVAESHLLTVDPSRAQAEPLIVEAVMMLKREHVIVPQVSNDERISAAKVGVRAFFYLGSSVSRHANALLLRIEAILTLIAVDVSLRVIGFGGFMEVLSHDPCYRPSDPGSRNKVAMLSSAFLDVFRFYRSEAACLQRALGLALLLRRHGLRARVCLGVRVSPFASHAWAEFEDLVLGDSARGVRSYTVIAQSK
jgi:hypothetical protein